MLVPKLFYGLPLEIELTFIVAINHFSYVRIIWKSRFVGRGVSILLSTKRINEMEAHFTFFYSEYSDEF